MQRNKKKVAKNKSKELQHREQQKRERGGLAAVKQTRERRGGHYPLSDADPQIECKQAGGWLRPVLCRFLSNSVPARSLPTETQTHKAH